MIVLHDAGHAAHLRHHKATVGSLPSASLVAVAWVEQAKPIASSGGPITPIAKDRETSAAAITLVCSKIGRAPAAGRIPLGKVMGFAATQPILLACLVFCASVQTQGNQSLPEVAFGYLAYRVGLTLPVA
jgi:hypothetical protein